MKINRNEKRVSNAELAALFKAFEVGSETSDQTIIAWSPHLEELFEILPDAFTIHPIIRRSEAISLFRKSLIACRRAGQLNAEKMIQCATRIYKDRIAGPEHTFKLWTKFRAQDMALSPGFRLKWRGVLARTAVDIPKVLELDDYFFNGIGDIVSREPIFSGHVILYCKDRSEHAAVDQMMEALQLMLGLINMYESWGRHSFMSSRNRTEGGLWLGPYQFLFKNNIFRGREHIWYNPDYDETAWKLHQPTMPRVLRVIPHVRQTLAALENHPFRDVLVRSILLLQDGFATRDSSYRLLRYWSALEHLYVEVDNKGKSNEKVLDRAIFAEINPALSKWKLRHIARLRNEYVHVGGIDDDLHPLCQFLRHLIGRHLRYWIFNSSEIPNHTAMLKMVQLPGNRVDLQNMRNAIERRIAIIDSAPPSPAP